MKFSRLYSLLVESEEISKNIKSRDPKEIWNVAQDIRKHIEDYPDVSLGGVLKIQKDRAEKKGEEVEFVNVIQKYNPLCKIKNTYYYLSPINAYKILPKPFEDWLIASDKHGSYNKFPSAGMANSYIDSIKRQYKSLSQSSEGDKIFSRKFDGIDVNARLARVKKIHDFMHSITPEDKQMLMQHYKITVPDIYHYLIETSYNLPKHPSELSKELHTLPRSMLDRMVHESRTPIQFAVESSRSTAPNYNDSVDSGFSITGIARILDIDSNHNTNYPPTKKEAFAWMKYIAEKYVKDAADDELAKQSPYGFIQHDFQINNFPSWMIIETEKNKDKVWNARQDFSFQTWMVFRWFLYHMDSTYFNKTIRVNGPAGVEGAFIPGNYLAKIQEVDLENGIKTSPEKAFQNASIREAKAFEETNKEKEFPVDFDDTENVKVIRNSRALKREGERMNHCVGGYGPSCLNGSSLILSLPNSTAELNPTTLAIYQHRGRGNGEPPEEDYNFLQQWLRKQLQQI